MFNLLVAGRVGEDVVFTEEEWASEEKSVPYEKSKLRAELAAWELVKGLPGIIFTRAGLNSRYCSHFRRVMYSISFGSKGLLNTNRLREVSFSLSPSLMKRKNGRTKSITQR